MATPIWFSGSSPDAAFAREDAWRRERTGVLEGDRSARAQADAMTLQAFLNNQAREDRLREVDFNRNWQSQEAASRTGEFARQFDANLAYNRDVLKNQSKMDAARLKSFANETALAGELEAQDYFAKPRPISDVDFNLLTRTTGLPQPKLRSLAEKADADYAATQAAQLNAQFFNAQQKQIAALNVPTLPLEMVERLRKSIEAQAVKIHPLVKFNYRDNAWEFTGGGKKSLAIPGAHVPIGRPPETVTGTTPAFFAPPAPTPAARAAVAPIGNMGGGYFPPAVPAAALLPSLRPITREIAVQFLKQARGDRELARKLARDAGFSF